MTSKPHTLIIGAGIAGLTLAQSLRKQGVPFEIFERDLSDASREQGYALGLYDLDALFDNSLPNDVPPLRNACHLLPLPLPSQVVFHVSSERMLIVEDCPETPCVRANRARLRQVLSTGLDIQWNKEATHFEETDDSVAVFFRDGTSALGQVLIAVDGVYSAIRPQILKRSNQDVLHMYPNPPIAGVLKLRGEDMEQQLRLGHSGWNAFGPGFTVFCGVNRVNIEADGTVSGDYYWVLSNNESAVQGSSDQELLDYAVAKVQTLEPHFRSVVEKTKVEGVRHSFNWVDAVVPGSIFPPVKRVVLIGDACRPMTPNRGEGAIFAIREAVQLGKILGSADASDMPSLSDRLDAFQRNAADKGHEAVLAARATMTNARKGTLPRVWGHDMRVITELKPLPFRLSDWEPNSFWDDVNGVNGLNGLKGADGVNSVNGVNSVYCH